MPTDALHARAPAAWVAVRHWMYANGIKSAAGLTLPDFLGIGAQKAGSTWLHRNLLAHPKIFMPPEAKEVHFFDKHYLDYGLEGYASLFRGGHARVKGEITPAYGIISPRRIRFVRAVLPNVKLIFLMRNPIDRAWSHALMELVTERGRPLEQVRDAEFLDHFRAAPSLRRGDYQTILGNWLAVFPRKQLFTGFFDDLAGYPRRLLTEIFHFLGLPADVDLSGFPCDEVFHQGPGAAMPARFRQTLAEMYDEPIRRLGEKFGAPSRRWLEN